MQKPTVDAHSTWMHGGAKPAFVRTAGECGEDMMLDCEVDPGRNASLQPEACNRSTELVFVLVALAALAVYWVSSCVLVARNGTLHFHVDTWLYSELSEPDLFARILPDTQLARIFRFHPVTVIIAAGWMKVVSPLTMWFTPAQLLKGLFAAVGALGVWASLRAFAVLLPRRHALLWGVIYASSLGIWYFSSIEESKIVTATLSALYIATYLRMRETWTLSRAMLLTAILLIACLNEIVAAFLVAIPAVDAIVRERWEALKRWWIAAHAMAAIFALALLEGVIRSWPSVVGIHPEGANHFSMFLWYGSQVQFNFDRIYYFLASWLFFNIAAPERYAHHWADFSIHFGGIFRPGLANYGASLLSAALVAVFATLLAAVIFLRKKISIVPNVPAIMLALLAYALVRAVFFFVFNAKESMLFSPSATLAHLLLLAIPFAATSLPERAKVALLALLAALLFVNNGRFIVG